MTKIVHEDREGRSDRILVPKLCGADVELGNFILGPSRTGSTAGEAASRLLREIDGVSQNVPLYLWASGGHAGELPFEGRAVTWYVPADSQDWGRKFLSANGGCVYIDLNHLELCLPEVTGAHDFVACWHAMLRIARAAQQVAGRRLPEGERLQVLVNNSDGMGSSYGSHLDFLMTRRSWDDMFRRKLHHLLYLASYQASSIVFAGQGKVGSENGSPAVSFQLSQRADFFETLIGTQTMENRPVVNSRDEPLCGRAVYGGACDTDGSDLARLHVIFYDSTLSHVATLLKVGVLQIVLAMIEAGQISADSALDDPVDAVWRWSHDPTLQRRERLVSGQQLTAVEHQLLMLEDARKFAEQGGCEGIVPRAPEILDLWEDTLTKLRARDLGSLAGRLDWVLKLSILQTVRDRQPRLGWDAPEIKHLDQLFASLDESEGLYWAYERSGLVQQVVSDAEIRRFVVDPPDDTRAWTRATLLRAAGSDRISDVDWDYIRFRTRRADGPWLAWRTIDLPDPTAFTKASVGPLVETSGSLDEILDGLEEMPRQNGQALMCRSIEQ